MIGEGVDIGDVLNLARAGAGTADAPAERDDKTAVSALIGADLQHLGAGDAVKAGPVGQGMGVVDLADHRGHKGDSVGFAMGQRVDRGGDCGAIQFGGDVSSQGRSRPFWGRSRRSGRHRPE